MKIKSGFIVREVAGSRIVIAVGERAAEFRGVVKLNETGAFLWNHLELDTDIDALVTAMTDEYEVSEDVARRDVETFVGTLKTAGILE